MFDICYSGMEFVSYTCSIVGIPAVAFFKIRVISYSSEEAVAAGFS